MELTGKIGLAVFSILWRAKMARGGAEGGSPRAKIATCPIKRWRLGVYLTVSRSPKWKFRFLNFLSAPCDGNVARLVESVGATKKRKRRI